MSNAIKDFESLKERWPGIMNIVKAINGFDVDCSYDELVALNLEIESDVEGMEIATRAAMQLMKEFEEGNTEVKAWLEENGFVSKRNIALQKEMDEIIEKIEAGEYFSSEEFQQMADRLLDIQSECMRSAERHTNSMGKGLFGIRTAITEA